jgi:RNA recognition motif-containing protein
VRNLPLEIEEDNVKEFFSKFGDVAFAKVNKPYKKPFIS